MSIHVAWSVLAFAGMLFLFRRFPGSISAAVDDLSNALIPLGLMFGASLVSTFMSPFPHSSYPSFLNDVNALGFFILFAAHPGRDNLLKALLGGAAVLAFIGGVGAALPGMRAGMEFAVNPNLLAAFLLLVLPAMAVTAFRENALRRIFWWAAAGICVLCLLFTGSFLAFLVFLIVLIVFFARAGGGTSGARRGVWIACALFLVIGAWLYRAEWVKLTHLEPDRWSWWRSALRMWSRHPLWGVGPGAFGEAYPGFRADQRGLSSLYAHNFFLEMLAERGIAGAGAFLFSILVLWRRVREKAVGDHLLFSAALGLAGFLVYNFGNIAFSFPSGSWAFWSLAGYLWGATSARRSEGTIRVWLERGAIALALMLSLGLGYASVRLFWADRSLAQARFALSRGDAATAQAFAEKGLAWNRREPELHSILAHVAAVEQRWDEALRHNEESRRLSPFTTRFQNEAADIAEGMRLRHGR
ncbi:MAG: O-antigen ligase family protein [Elusimicrobia bacterium]|nr:O-antigen ligase family protein [Elusimicrobiota bacterium]